ncbi:helicase-associated domain-containing protein [Streptomyces sp. PSKA54]|uniref:Helicase-associated domain-containing protein n=1 Tax=Streptomyces himalayensis subsp. aureolus TaxID=2758039 RepID=A0A7W2HK55_9ACTN|nr:helicase C-terminal domain-containing protein [Streptomyces himalayensis]MBA4866806.1 helicase-associated domain-containing protein [Streptomyces himalayensis subsp. aureolus]
MSTEQTQEPAATPARPAPEAAAPPRSLAEALRARDDESLAALLRARPDLLSPVPGDLTQLATRAGTRASVVRALERLDRFALQTAEALAVAPDPATYERLLSLLTGDRTEAAPEATAAHDRTLGTADPAVATIEHALPRALATLREQALVWGPDDRLRLVRTARELLTPSPQHPSPTGLGPTVAETTAGMSPGRIQEIVAAAGLPTTHDAVSAVAALTELFTDRSRMSALLDDAPAESVAVLSRLVWGPPYGQVTADPAPHLRWLLDRGLLLPTAPGTVVLPREAALHLRGGRAHRQPEPVPPALEPAAEHRPQVVDATAAGQAYTALATVDELLKDWDEGGPAVLRAGGLSVRDLKRTAVALDVSEPLAAFWVELAYAAGLLASDGEADERYAATPAYDEWLELPVAERWAQLASAWLTATRTAGLVGARDAKDRTLSALGPGLDRSAAPEVRHRVLALLATLPEGSAPTTESLLARLRWERPLRTSAVQPSPSAAQDDLRTRLARWTLQEAELLGVTGRGALSSPGRALLGAAPAPAAGPATTRGTAGAQPPAPGLPTSAGTWRDEQAAGTAVQGVGAPAPGDGVTTPGDTEARPSEGGTQSARAGRAATTAGTEADTTAEPEAATMPNAADRPGAADKPGTADKPGAADRPSTAEPEAATMPNAADRPGAGAGAKLPARKAITADETATGAPPTGAQPTGGGTAPPGPGVRRGPAEAPAGAPATGPAAAATVAPATPPTRAEAAVNAARAARLLAPLLPEPLDHVLLQADLTAVAPGPLQRPLADMLDVLADVESKGGATVYRFTPGSVRRALDAGRSASDLHAFLAAHSRTPVPQPLAYLIDDVARKHGHLRIGAASAYVRCDDDAVLNEILADKRSAALRLRRLAPTVLAAQADPVALLDGLRGMGFAPAAEGPEGDVLITRAHAHRTPPRTAPEPVPEGPPVPDTTLLGAAVRAIRAGDRASTAPRRASPEHTGELPRTTPAETLATMQAAVLTGQAVWIGYVNAEGAASQRVIAPVRVEGGFVTAYDHTADEVRTYPLHRITGVAELVEGQI